jgi:DNA gyrase subunit A
MREVISGVQWYLEDPEASREELLAALMQRIKGPDFPSGAQILGRKGIEDAYRTGRGSIAMRAVVNVEEIQGRTCLVVTELPYMANPDNLAAKIAEMVRDGKLSGIADMRDETSGRTGQRLVIVLKRDAVPKVVLNNLYKHTQLQENFSANMLALVDGVPRTLSLDGFVHHWVMHQIEVIVRRTEFRKRKAEERAHILLGLLKALAMLDEVIATIRRSASADVAREALKTLLEIDDDQAQAILNMQLRSLAALESQKLQDEYDELQAKIAQYNAILASPERQREVVSTELAEIGAKYGDDRRTEIMYGYDGDMSIEDLIPEEEMVVTITRGGYIKRTRIDNYRAQNRGGKGVRGASLRNDDVVEHFFTTSTHHWILFFTNLGRVYRIKTYELQEAGRDAKGQHVANLMAFQPEERIAQVLALSDYGRAPYLVLATRAGLVKKTLLADYDTNRAAGVIAIKLREGDEVVSAQLVSEEDDLILISKNGQSLRFNATNEALRPMGRATSGVTGMKFRQGDELLTVDVIREDAFVFTVTDGGYAKRSAVDEYRVQNRGGLGIKVGNIVEDRGELTGGLVVEEEDEVLVVMNSGKVVRSAVTGVPAKGRNTMGVIFAKPDKNDRIIAVTLNNEKYLTGAADEDVDGEASGQATEGEVPLDSETGAPATEQGPETTMTATESAAVESDQDAEIDGGQ